MTRSINKNKHWPKCNRPPKRLLLHSSVKIIFTHNFMKTKYALTNNGWYLFFKKSFFFFISFKRKKKLGHDFQINLINLVQKVNSPVLFIETH